MKYRKKSILTEFFLIIVLILFVFILAFWIKIKPNDSFISAKTIFTEDLKNNVKEVVCPLNEKKPIVTERNTIEKVFSLLQSVNLQPTDGKYLMGSYLIQMNTDNETIFLSISNSEFVINKKHYKVDRDICDEIYSLLFNND